jgi:predicted O-methyltransferase YrrM
VSLRTYSEGLLRRAGVKVVPVERNGLAVEATPADVATYESVRAFTMTSAERLWALMRSVRYIVENGIPGDFVECGVWRGGSAMAMALTLADLRVERQLWLYDTFQGMTSPTGNDVEAGTGKSAGQLLSRVRKREGNTVWCVASLEDVTANMEATGYPSDRVVYRAGDVAQTLLGERPAQIALLRLDTDWYESTKAELEVLYPLLVPGGVCIVDDYGHWEGARQAVDEYLAARDIRPFLHRIDNTGRVFLKP